MAMWSLRSLLTAPVRFIRYLDQPGAEHRARLAAMSDEEKAEYRRQESKLYGWYAWFPSPFPDRRKK